MCIRYLFLILTFLTLNAAAQNEEEKVKATINTLFEGLRKGDSSLLRKAFAPGAIMQTIAKPKTGGTVVRTDTVAAFIRQVSAPHSEVYDEQIRFSAVYIDGDLASVWTPYRFYVGSQFSHCGVNSFQLVKLAGEWKIQYLIDTRQREGCN